jgi:nuclear transport factor 2 (NTF2) superfamily protein
MAEDAWNTRTPRTRRPRPYRRCSAGESRRVLPGARHHHVPVWARELEYRLIKNYGRHENRIAVRFQYEWHDDSANWYRAHGNEQWEFDAEGLMRRREASINDVPISETERRFHWPQGPRPADHPGLSELGM